MWIIVGIVLVVIAVTSSSICRHVSENEVIEYLNKKLGSNAIFKVNVLQKPRSWQVILDSYPKYPFKVYEYKRFNQLLPIYFWDITDNYHDIFNPLLVDELIKKFGFDKSELFQYDEGIKITGIIGKYKVVFNDYNKFDKVFEILKQFSEYLIETHQNGFLKYTEVQVKWQYLDIGNGVYMDIKAKEVKTIEYDTMLLELDKCINVSKIKEQMEEVSLGNPSQNTMIMINHKYEYNIVYYSFEIIDEVYLDETIKMARNLSNYINDNYKELVLLNKARVNVLIVYKFKSGEYINRTFAEISSKDLIIKDDSKFKNDMLRNIADKRSRIMNTNKTHSK